MLPQCWYRNKRRNYYAASTDNVTFDGIDIQENAANVTTTTQMEWGYSLLKNSATMEVKIVSLKIVSLL